MPYTAAQLTAYYTSLTGVAPDSSTSLLFQASANQNAAGTQSDAQTLAGVFNSVGVQATFEVAESTYQFFTGATTSQAGLAYLEGTTGSGNANGLDTAYYNGTGGSITAPSTTNGFNTENRYYNFALNLATGAGAGASNFSSSYGGLTFAQTVAAAYENIVGSANVGTANANAAIADITSRMGYFQQVAATRGGDATALSNPNGSLALKAVVVGYILEEANKADVGTYAKAIDQFEASVAQGNAIFNTNLLNTYQAGGSGFNTGVGLTGTTGTLGQTLAFTPGTDTFNTTAGNTTFVGQVGGATAGTAGTSPTLGPSDIVNAAGGNNTLITNVVTGGAAGATQNASGGAILNGIQTVDVRVTDGTAAIGATLSQTAVPNATTLNSYLSTGRVTFTDVAGSTTVGIVGNGSQTGSSLFATYATSATTTNLALSGGVLSSIIAGGGVATNANITNGTTLNITSSGQANSLNNLTDNSATSVNIVANSALTVSTNTAFGAATSLNVSGTGAVDLGSGLLSGTLRTVTSTDAGGLRASFTTAATGTTITTSATGIDRITLDQARANTVVNTGGGGDTIQVTGAIAAGASLNGSGGATLAVTTAGYGTVGGFTAAQRGLITGFSTLAITDAGGLTTGTTYDANLIGAQNFTSNGVAAGGAATVNVASGAVVTFLGGATGVGTNTGALTINEANAALSTSTNDTLTLGFTGQTANAGTAAAPIAITANGVEQVQVISNLQAAPAAGAAAPVVALTLQDTQAQSITFAGNEGVNFTTGATGGGGASTFAQLTNVSAANSTAANVINVATINTATLAAPINVTGGSGVDTITFHDFARVTGGAGNDLFVAAQTTNSGSYSTIVDAAAGDTVGFVANPVPGTAAGAGAAAPGAQVAVIGANATKIVLAATASFQDYLNAAINQSTAGQVRDFDFGGNTYLVDHNSATGTRAFMDATDTVVQLVGIHTISSTLGATAGGASGGVVTIAS